MRASCQACIDTARHTSSATWQVDDGSSTEGKVGGRQHTLSGMQPAWCTLEQLLFLLDIFNAVAGEVAVADKAHALGVNGLAPHLLQQQQDCRVKHCAGAARSSSHKQLKVVWGDLQGGCASLAEAAVPAAWQTRQMVTATSQAPKAGAHWGQLGGRPSWWVAGWSALLLCPLLLPLLVVSNGLLHNCWLAAKPAGPEGGAWRSCVQRRRRTLLQESHNTPCSAETSSLGSGKPKAVSLRNRQWGHPTQKQTCWVCEVADKSNAYADKDIQEPGRRALGAGQDEVNFSCRSQAQIRQT